MATSKDTIVSTMESILSKTQENKTVSNVLETSTADKKKAKKAHSNISEHLYSPTNNLDCVKPHTDTHT